MFTNEDLWWYCYTCRFYVYLSCICAKCGNKNPLKNYKLT